MRSQTIAVLLLLVVSGCSKQSAPPAPPPDLPPSVQSITVQPARVHAAQTVLLSCSASDTRGRFLRYWWSTTGGSFPTGYQASAVSWATPPSLDAQTVTVHVTNFTDSTTANHRVDIVRVAAPDSVRFVDGANVIDLSWSASPDEAIEGWSGYEVFAAPRSIADLSPDSVGRYLLNATPLPRPGYRVAGVVPGVKTFYDVRARRDYQGVTERSAAGPEIETAPRLDGFGAGSLFEVASRRGATGVHLPGGTLIPLDVASRDSVDIYLGTADAQDADGADLRLKSPALLAYRDPAWGSRVTGILLVGQDWDVAVPPDTAYASELPVTSGGVYALQTADGHAAKFRVLELRGSAPERRVEFEWAWQPIAGYPRY